MFWLSYAHVTTDKYQRSASKTFELANQLTIKYMHVILKSKKAFRDDFQCDEMTPEEMHRLAEFQKKVEYTSQALQLWKLNSHDALPLPILDYITRYENGFFDFIKSLRSDSLYHSDLEDMRKLLEGASSNSTYLIETVVKVFSSVCFQNSENEDGCNFFF